MKRGLKFFPINTLSARVLNVRGSSPMKRGLKSNCEFGRLKEFDISQRKFPDEEGTEVFVLYSASFTAWMSEEVPR